MKKIYLLCALIFTYCTNRAHVLPTITAAHYTIQTEKNSTNFTYDITQGVVHHKNTDGSERTYAHVHMGHTAPAQARQIFGTITVASGDSHAGTWYIYR